MLVVNLLHHISVVGKRFFHKNCILTVLAEGTDKIFLDTEFILEVVCTTSTSDALTGGEGEGATTAEHFEAKFVGGHIFI